MGGIVGGGSNKAGAAAAASAAQARADEEARKTRINTGMTNINDQFAQFTPDYYDQKSNAYSSYYLPQLSTQYDEAKKQTTYGLSRTGNLDSQAGADAFGKLARAYSEQQGMIGNQAQQSASDLRANVEGNKSDLITQLNSTADPNLASQSAQARAAVIASQPQQLSPLANAFEALTASFGNAAVQGGYNTNSPFYGTTIGNIGRRKDPTTIVQ